ncbi:hypothetical protein MJO28_001274 [Puccinia striiformis f. sp. tritici]|uniref:Uncharacterized protein n=1 Tax=Puccinia striiformis f. sp. tritici TaxID=168172 RepID=A0ACC0ETH8_9BASI|nr:hypothetical protein MJO28_001274 [Puccinia striiformis f. sp. tritici]
MLTTILTTLVLQTYIRSWQQSVHRPASKSKSQLTYTNGQTIIIQTDHRLTLVDKMILSSQLSDLDLLQLQWTLDLPTLEKLITPRKIIPLLKLFRTLTTKLSDSYDIIKFRSGLSPMISSYTLHRLEEPAELISSDLELLIEFVSHPIDRNVELTNHQINEIRSLIINQISKELNNFFDHLGS